MDSYYSAKFANSSARTTVGPIDGVVGNSIIEAISHYLNVNTSSFDIYDYKKYEDGVLVLVHYKNDTPIEGLRGIILFISTSVEDVRNWEIKTIAPSGPVIKQIECEITPDGTVKIHDLDCSQQYEFRPSFESLSIRIFKFRGETFFCTYKTFYAANKIWGNSVFFGQMWETDINMPFDIFPEGTVNSKYCHNYCIVHRDLQYSSRFSKMDKGFAVYFGTTETGLEGHPDEKAFDYGIKWPTHSVETPFITNTLKYSDENGAFDFLKYGFYKQYSDTDDIDWELNPGEKLFIKGNGKFYECWSPGATKRKEMREKSYSSGIATNLNSYFNVLSRALDMKTGLVIDLNKKNEEERQKLIAEQKSRYMDFFHPIKPKENKEFSVFFDYITKDDIPVFPISTPDVLKIVTEYYIWLLPPFMKEQNQNLLGTYYDIVEKVALWLLEFRHNNSKPYIFDVVLKTCPFQHRSKHDKTISWMCEILHEATKYGLDSRNFRGEESIPDNVRFLLKRRYAYQILMMFQLKMRYDIAISSNKNLFGPEYSKLLDGDGINSSALWSENIDVLYPLHKKIMESAKHSPIRCENKKEQDKRVFTVVYGPTYNASKEPEVERKLSPPSKKLTITRVKI